MEVNADFQVYSSGNFGLTNIILARLDGKWNPFFLPGTKLDGMPGIEIP